MEVTRKQALQVFAALGMKKAATWDIKRTERELMRLKDRVGEDVDIEDEETKELFENVCAAAMNGTLKCVLDKKQRDEEVDEEEEDQDQEEEQEEEEEEDEDDDVEEDDDAGEPEEDDDVEDDDDEEDVADDEEDDDQEEEEQNESESEEKMASVKNRKRTKNATAAKAGSKPTKPTRPAKAAKPSGNGHMSALDAAHKVLSGTKKSMSVKELIEAMASRKLWESPSGKTPGATLSAGILKDIQKNGKKSRFKKTAPGQFAAGAGA